ncbi:hypothetical protein [Streptomyces sp. NPDC093060]|uniref:hypothetical protein n=1 Tax=Streptomyces sp. NPDC093060 TaxID=3366019 RepID=UPI0038023E91
MRDPETDRLLTDVRRAVAAARAGGATTRACIFDATTAAVDADATAWPSDEARHAANNACRVVEPPTVKANPAPRSKPPALTRLLWHLANRVAERKQQQP